MSILPYLYDVQRPVRERDMFRPEDFYSYPVVPREYLNPNQLFSPTQFNPAQLFKSLENMMPWESFVLPIEQLASAMNQLAVADGSKIYSDEETFQVNIDVQHFAPDEINVKVVEGFVVVEGKHDEKRDQHGFVSRQFVRRYPLPQGCLPDTVESKLSSDGVLTVFAPMVLPMPSSGERIVPIKQTGPIKKQIGTQETNAE